MRLSRRELILALAWSLPDAIRQPITATGSIAGQQRREASPTAWAVCATCHGDRVVVDRWRRESACPTCLGAGRYRVDPYTDQPVASLDAPVVAARPSRRVVCDRCDGQGTMLGRWVGETGLVRCEACDGVGKLDAPPVDEERSGRSSDRLAWVLGGDWPVFDRELCRLEPRLRRAFVAGFVQGGPVSADAWLALEQVTARLPARLRVPADVRVAYLDRDRRARLWREARSRRMGRSARRARNLEARRLLQAGVPAGEVAGRLGVSERQLRRIA